VAVAVQYGDRDAVKEQTMIISVINHTNGKITDETLQHAIRAINRQIEEDFAPYWSRRGAPTAGRFCSKPPIDALG
jgi:hypothetical protein